MRESAEVVIIGGGIQGTSVAYHLAEKGLSEVVLVEMEYPGYGSSGLTAAMLMHQTGQELTTQLAKLSIEEYLSYRKKLGVDIGLHKIGSICFATNEESAGRLNKHIKMQNKLGIETKTLNSKDVYEFAPLISADGILLGAYCPGDGFADPYSVMQAYVAVARRCGIEINLEVKATGIKTEGSSRQVIGVETNKGFIETRYVINAAGALARQIGNWLNIEIPIRNYKRNIILLAPRPPQEAFPIVEDIVTEWYIRPEGRNVMVGVGPQTEVGSVPDTLRPPFDDKCLDALADYIKIRAPKLLDAGITPMKWAGVRDLTDDELPILGPIDEVQGFLNCCGWSGFGVTLAPITGKLLAELIVDGKTTVDITPFLLRRFQSR